MRKTKNSPPAAAAWILARVARKDDRSSVRDDFREIYEEISGERGRGAARRWYWGQILRSLPAFLSCQICWSWIMFQNYAKAALRSFRRHLGTSLINLTGLAVGFASCLLIFLWVLDEVRFDAFHKDAGRIYQVLAHSEFENSDTPTRLGPALKEEFPEISGFVRFHYFFGGDMIAANDKVFYENGVRIADSGFFEFFTFPLLKGDPRTALKDPRSIVISRSTAAKYFPGEEALGKPLILNRENPFTVTGIFADIPAGSSLRFDMIVPMAFRIASTGAWYLDWNNLFPQTFVKLVPGARADDLDRKIAGFLSARTGGKDRISLMPFRERHFRFFADVAYVYIFAATAVFVLAIAWFNFINLATARSADRAKEIGMRKVSGAFRSHIITQFLGESLLLSLIAFGAALVLARLFLPFFNGLTGKSLSLGYPGLIAVAALFALLTGLAAGVYPAVFLSGFEPAKVIRGKLKAGVKNARFRKSLVVVQFTLSVLLMIGVVVIHKQIGYARRTGTGYNGDNLILLTMKGGSQKSYGSLKRELLRSRNILDVTGTAVRLPYFSWRQTGFDWEGRDPGRPAELTTNTVNFDFARTYGIELAEGRDFSPDFPADVRSSCLVNEELARLMGGGKVLGRELRQGEDSYRIIGIVKNFHFQALNKKIEPLVLRLDPEAANCVAVRIPPGSPAEALEDIRGIWERLVPGYPFAYSFFDEALASGYGGTRRTGLILGNFAVLAIIISCLGLFGLASFTAEQRTKEIGIRKVLGSSVGNIYGLMAGEYLKCIALANLAAGPLAYFIMKSWLRKFAYRTAIGAGPFLLAAAAAFLVALLTVSRQALRTARAKPVDALRYE